MSWEFFILLHAFLGMAFAIMTIHWQTYIVLLFGTILLWIIPFILYFSSANSNNSFEFEAWSLLFIVPAGLVSCAVLYVIRLGKWVKNRKQ